MKINNLEVGSVLQLKEDFRIFSSGEWQWNPWHDKVYWSQHKDHRVPQGSVIVVLDIRTGKDIVEMCGGKASLADGYENLMASDEVDVLVLLPGGVVSTDIINDSSLQRCYETIA